MMDVLSVCMLVLNTLLQLVALLILVYVLRLIARGLDGKKTDDEGIFSFFSRKPKTRVHSHRSSPLSVDVIDEDYEDASL